MPWHSIIRTALILGSVASIAEAQPSDNPEGRKYKVAFWFELARPFSTTQYQAYDLARGQFDQAAVDRWQQTIRESHPDFGTTIRNLSTAGEPGATEAERLANAVEREKRRWVDLNLRESKSVPKLVQPSTPPERKDKEVGRASFDRPAPGSPRTPLYPSPSPFPYPYRSGPR